MSAIKNKLNANLRIVKLMRLVFVKYANDEKLIGRTDSLIERIEKVPKLSLINQQKAKKEIEFIIEESKDLLDYINPELWYSIQQKAKDAIAENPDLDSEQILLMLYGIL